MKKYLVFILLYFGSFHAKVAVDQLGYSYKALEPVILEEIMKLHYDKHYQGYAKKLNNGLRGYKKFSNRPLEGLLKDLDNLPEELKRNIRNNGGGVYNHSLFWKSMHPQGKRRPTGKLLTAITTTFGSYSAFQKEFNKAADSLFGSGWVWLCIDFDGKLLITTSANQDCPLSQKMKPLLNLDLWEHAYYLQYKNRRSDYCKKWWSIVDWQNAEILYLETIK